MSRPNTAPEMKKPPKGAPPARPVRRLAVPDVPIPYARPLEEEVLPDADDVAAAVRSVHE